MAQWIVLTNYRDALGRVLVEADVISDLEYPVLQMVPGLQVCPYVASTADPLLAAYKVQKGSGTSLVIDLDLTTFLQNAGYPITFDGVNPGAPLSDSNPSAVGTTAPGVGTAASRFDHVHAHGNQLGGSLHTLATVSLDGFMSAGGKAKLDSLFIPYITYQKGGTSGAGVVATWAEVDAFANAQNVPWVLFYDNSVALCDVPSSAATDFRYLTTIRYSGASSVVPGNIALIARDGCTIKGIGAMGTNSQISCEALTVTPIIFEDEGTVVIFREGGAIVLDDINGTPTVPAISVTNGQQILAFLEGGSLGTASGNPAAVPVVDFTVVGGFHIVFQLVNSRGGNGLPNNILQADATTNIINGHDSTAKMLDQSLFFSGNLIDNPIALARWGVWDTGDTASRPTGVQQGSMYFDTDLLIPIWWDSTQWVNALGVPA